MKPPAARAKSAPGRYATTCAALRDAANPRLAGVLMDGALEVASVLFHPFGST